MKKLIFFSFFLIIFTIFYYYTEYSTYSISSACIRITNSGEGEVPSIPDDENGSCMKIRTGSVRDAGDVSAVVSGIRYKVVFISPEKKNDDDLGKSEDASYEEPLKKKRAAVIREAGDEPSDIVIAVINGSEADGFTKEELLESVINIQNSNPDVDIIVTDRFQIPSERIVVKNVLTLDVMGISSVITIRYKVVFDKSGKPVSISKESLDRRYPDTGKIEKK